MTMSGAEPLFNSLYSINKLQQYTRMVEPLLTELSLDLQIHICEFLHPLHILALRQTCKACYQATSQRIVWIRALNRICHQHSLFLPSFPIPYMSVFELERAATAPSRWIASSSSKDRNADGFLPSRTTRIIKNPIPSTANDLQDMKRLEFKYQQLVNLYLVPGGRYLVASSCDCLGVWDLGYVCGTDMSSDGKSTTVWATRVNKIDSFTVQPTSDGLGIRILTCSSDNMLHVFEVYPQNETHEHAKIAELKLGLRPHAESLLCGDRVVIYIRSKGTVIVWDFKANTVASWSVSIPNGALNKMKIIRVTEKTIGIFYHTYGASPIIRVFQTPPLITKTPLFDNQEDLPKVAPILTFEDPKVIATYSQRPDSWYFGYGDLNSLPFYLDVRESRTGNVVGRCTLDISSDLSDLSLTPSLNAPFTMQPLSSTQHYYSAMPSYRICEDSSVHVVSLNGRGGSVEAITVGFDMSSDGHGSVQTATTHVNSTRLIKAYPPFSFCPASGRCVHKTPADAGYGQDDLVIYDFL